MKKWFCFAVLCFGLASVAQVPIKNKMQDCAKSFKEATSEQKRLQLCIDAINQGLIYRGGPVGNIDQIFGTDFSKKVPTAGQPLTRGVVDFVNPLPPPSDAVAAAHTGWYLAFEFDYQGSIQNYYLSNLHK
jgi:hypothetical protein